MVGAEPGRGHDPVDFEGADTVGHFDLAVGLDGDGLRGESGDEPDPAGVHVLAQSGADCAAGRQRVGGLAAVGAGRARRPDRPGDLRARHLLGELGEDEQRVGGGVPGADDEGALAGEPVPVRAEDVGQGVLDERRGRGLAVRGDAGRAEDVRRGPGARRVDHRPGEQVGAVGEPDQERRAVPAGGAQPVQAQPGDGHHAGAVAHVWLERGQVGEGLQVLVGELRAGRQPLGVGLDPAGVGEEATGCGVDGVPPRREQPHVPPLPHRGGRAVTGFQDGERQTSLVQVRGGGQTDRAGPDHDDGQVFQAGGHGETPLS